jgi:hypothetical protein
MYYWDGQQWMSTLSHDGRSRWNGSAWIPTGQAFRATTFQSPPRTMREPTSWTRPLQYVVAGWYALQVVYVLSLPLWITGLMRELMAQSMNQSMQRQQQLNPTVSPPPAEVTDAMNSFVGSVMAVSLWVAVLLGAAFYVLVVIGALKRWTWIYYVVLVLSGFAAIYLPVNLLQAVGGSAMSAVNGITMPSWIYWFGLATGIPATALFVWMLVALVKHGPWAMTKVTPAPSVS